MSAFSTAYALWRSEPFPSGSTRDDLDELHADLALVDVWVADTVVPYAERGVVVPPAGVDIHQAIAGLAERLEGISRDETDAVSAGEIAAYSRYLTLTSDVLAAYERDVGHPSR